MRRLRLLGRVVDYVVDSMAVVAGVLILFMALSMTYAVLSRKLFGIALASTTELSSYSLLYITFLAAPWLVKQNGHVSVDILLNLLRPAAKSKAEAANSLMTALVAFLLVWYGTHVTLDAISTRAVITNILATPKYWLLAIIPVGSSFVVVEYVRQAARRWPRSSGRTQPEERSQ